MHTVRTGDGRYSTCRPTAPTANDPPPRSCGKLPAVRTWPLSDGPHGPCAYEADYGAALRALAHTGSALEVNTRVPLDPHIVRWWREEGDKAARLVS